MATKTAETPEVGVIVGRFQVHELHPGHIGVIDTVVAYHPKVLIILGLAPTKGTLRNPLDFESRKKMILAAYPNVTVLYLKDEPDDAAWSKKLDGIIEDNMGPRHKAVLYGGRDSFIDHYSGKFPTTVLEHNSYYSGTELRRDISSRVIGSPDFRAGVIWLTNNQYPAVVTCVDVAIEGGGDSRGNNPQRLLLVRKPTEKLFRFVGGHADPTSATFELDAAREVQEEVGVAIGGAASMHYIGSTLIDDWRYRSEDSKIKTLFFRTTYMYGSPRPDDDVCEARWFNVSELKEEHIVPEHRVLFKMWQEHHSHKS